MLQSDTETLTRIAAALERLAPGGGDADLATAPAYIWSVRGLEAVHRIDAMPLDRFAAVDKQRAAIAENTQRHAAAKPAHDVLLWGSRGMGKSALVRAAAAAAGTPVVQIEADRIADLPHLFARLGEVDRRFIAFVDDLGIDEEASLRHLRSVLDGGVRARPDNTRLYVTSNRRHIVKRDLADNEAAASVNPRDTLDDKLALAERFGLSLGFHNCSQDDYLAICRSLAAPLGLPVDDAEAIRFAHQRGARSGRIAAHYVTELAGQSGNARSRLEG